MGYKYTLEKFGRETLIMSCVSFAVTRTLIDRYFPQNDAPRVIGVNGVNEVIGVDMQNEVDEVDEEIEVDM